MVAEPEEEIVPIPIEEPLVEAVLEKPSAMEVEEPMMVEEKSPPRFKIPLNEGVEILRNQGCEEYAEALLSAWGRCQDPSKAKILLIDALRDGKVSPSLKGSRENPGLIREAITRISNLEQTSVQQVEKPALHSKDLLAEHGDLVASMLKDLLRQYPDCQSESEIFAHTSTFWTGEDRPLPIQVLEVMIESEHPLIAGMMSEDSELAKKVTSSQKGKRASGFLAYIRVRANRALAVPHQHSPSENSGISEVTHQHQNRSAKFVRSPGKTARKKELEALRRQQMREKESISPAPKKEVPKKSKKDKKDQRHYASY